MCHQTCYSIVRVPLLYSFVTDLFPLPSSHTPFYSLRFHTGIALPRHLGVCDYYNMRSVFTTSYETGKKM